MTYNYNLLIKEIEQIYQINNVLSVLYWDIAVNLPVKSLERRTAEITLLDNMTRSMIKSSSTQELLDKAYAESNQLSEWQIANLREIKKQTLNITCINDDLNSRYIAACAKCELIWRNAKRENDYNMLLPYLQEVLTYVKEIAGNRSEAFKCSKYDALIDLYDPDAKSQDIKIVFDELKKHIPELINQVLEKQKSQKTLPLDPTPIAQQKAIGKRIMEVMGFDFTRGRLDESTHPFSTRINPHDIRITSRYDEKNFLSGIMAIIHETGHALYEQNLPIDYAGQPVGQSKGMAIHESQSLFMEMQVGRSKAFCEFLSKLLRDEFGFKGAQYSGDNLYKLANRVNPSFIRVDADEVTYPMHVILRFELEELLINGDLTLKDIPKVWNDKMNQYLGIMPKTDSEGCMQDIHWPQGCFGYFPSYLKGAIIAAKLMHKLKAVYPSTQNEILNGEFNNINTFLNQQIRNYGSLKSPTELVEGMGTADVTNHDAFISYIQEKYC